MTLIQGYKKKVKVKKRNVSVSLLITFTAINKNLKAERLKDI